MNETLPKTYLNVNGDENFAEFYGKRFAFISIIKNNQFLDLSIRTLVQATVNETTRVNVQTMAMLVLDAPNFVN